MKTSIKYNNFSSGIINKNLQGRADMTLYNNSLEECKNFLINSQGGLEYRGGTTYQLTDEDGDYTNINFKYSEFKDFVLKVYSDGRIRIFSNENGQIVFKEELMNEDMGLNYNNLSYTYSFNNMFIVNQNMLPKTITYDGTNFSISDTEINITMSEGQTPPFMQDNRGYPNKVLFFKNRLCYFSTKERPTSIFVSDLNNTNQSTFRLASDENAIWATTLTDRQPK
jgi:hypothetical protein